MVLDVLVLVELTDVQVMAVIDCPVVGILRDPCASCAFCGIESLHRTKNFKKDPLRNVFRFTEIPNYSKNNRESEMTISVKQYGGRVLATFLYSHH